MMKSQRGTRLLPVLLGVLVLAAPLAAAPQEETSSPLATEELSGTILGLRPLIAYEWVVVRVSGPEGYALTTRIEAGLPISVDLLTEAEGQLGANDEREGGEVTVAPRERSADGLPEGQYHYEVVFTDTDGNRQVHSDTFFVEGGSVVSRAAKRAEIAALRETLMAAAGEVARGEIGRTPAAAFEDYVGVYGDNPRLNLGDDNPAGTPIMGVQNLNGSLRLKTGVGSGSGTPHLTAVSSSGNIGIGTTAPQRRLHIASGAPVIRLEDTDTGGETFHVEANGDFSITRVGSGSAVGIFIEEDATGGGCQDCVGIHRPNPNAALHVMGRSATGPNTMTVERNDAVSPNIRFRKTNGADQSWLFQNNANSGVFAIRDETGGNSVLRLIPASPEGALVINANGSFSTSTGASLSAGGAWQNASSRALKTAIEALGAETAMAALSELEPVSFEYKAEPGERQLGFIAEEVPELIASADRKGLSPMDITAVLTRVAQEQQRVVNEQQRLLLDQRWRLAEHERSRTEQAKLIAELRARIERLETHELARGE